MPDLWIDTTKKELNIELVKGAMVHHSADLGGGRTGDYDANNRLLRVRQAQAATVTISNLGAIPHEEKLRIDRVLRHYRIGTD